MMGLRTPRTPPPSGLPGPKRSRSGSPNTMLSSALPSSRRISQSTLHNIFIGMMGTAFSLYVVFTTYLIRHHHNNSDFGTAGGNWGPNSEMLDNTDEILKAHIQKLRELQQQQLQHPQDPHSSSQAGTANELLSHTLNEMTVSKHAVHEEPSPHLRVSLTLEEVDIHDMKHPKEIHKEPHRTTTSKITAETGNGFEPARDRLMSSPTNRVLKAYLEPVYLSDWNIKPLPVRNTTKEQLQVIEYPRVNSCQRLPELWPVDDYPGADPFLP